MAVGSRSKHSMTDGEIFNRPTLNHQKHNGAAHDDDIDVLYQVPRAISLCQLSDEHFRRFVNILNIRVKSILVLKNNLKKISHNLSVKQFNRTSTILLVFVLIRCTISGKLLRHHQIGDSNEDGDAIYLFDETTIVRILQVSSCCDVIQLHSRDILTIKDVRISSG